MGPRSNKKGKPRKFKSGVEARRLGPRKAVLPLGKTILIVCEDSKSSPDYFEKLRETLRLGTVNVEVCGKECGSAPINVVNYAKDKKRSVKTSTIIDKYDEIFCIVDVDEHTSLGNAVQTARDNGIGLIISNPCFEYWYILHFEKTGSSYNDRPQLYKALEAHLKRAYSKSGCDFFEVIYPLTGTATKNSEDILRSQWQGEADLRKCNPSTHVHRVVECILEIATQSRR